MEITKTIEIDMGHRVPNHESKCRNSHGHRYKIEVGVDGKVIDTSGDTSEGMVIDFGKLKDIMMRVIDANFDHSFAYYKDDVYRNFYEQQEKDGLKLVRLDFIPTAENLASLWFKMLENELRTESIRLTYITVWETPTSTATYAHGDNF